MSFKHQQKARSLSIVIGNDIDEALIDDIHGLLSRAEVSCISIDVSTVTHLSVEGLRLLSDLQAYAAQQDTPFKLVGRKRSAVGQAFANALELATVYRSNSKFDFLSQAPA